MPINLNPGADTSLVTAATRAGLAGVPPDYSKTFQSATKSYYKTMEANAGMWDTIIKSGMAAWQHLDAQANGPQLSQEAEDLLGTDGFAKIGEELEGIKAGVKRGQGGRDKRETIINPDFDYELPEGPDNLKKIDNPNKGKRMNPFSKEAKDIRKKYMKERNDLYANLESQVGNIDAISAFVTGKDKNNNPLINKKATGVFAAENVSAILASRSGKTTPNGNYFVFEKGKDKEWGWTMYHDPSKVSPDAEPISGLPVGQLPSMVAQEDITTPYPIEVVDKNGDKQKIRYNANQIKEMLVLNDPKLVPNMEKDLDAFKKLGVDGVPWDDYTANRAGGIADKYANSRAAWHARTWAGEGGRSFFEETTGHNPDNKNNVVSGLSANIFNTLGNILPTDGKGNLLKEGVLSNIDEMIDGKAGISLADFQTEDNMKRLTLAMFNPGDGNYDKVETGRIFKNWMKKKLQDIHSHYYSAPTDGNGGNGGDGGGIKLQSMKLSSMFEGGTGEWLGKEDLKTLNFIRDNVRNRKSWGKGKNAWTWNENEYYTHQGLIIPNKEVLFESIYKRQLTDNFKSSNQWYINIPNWDATNLPEFIKQMEAATKGGKKKKRASVSGLPWLTRKILGLP